MNRSRELTAGLLHKARGDAHIIVRLAGDPETPAWILGFHAQQAIEKAIKAVLAARMVEYPLTHNLASLLLLLAEQGIAAPPQADRIPVLTSFSVAFRYDESFGEDEEIALDRAWLKQCVEQVLAWAETAATATT